MTPSFSNPAFIRIAVAIALASSAAGCVSINRRPHPKPIRQTTPAQTDRVAAPLPESRVGTVAMIGRGGKFVLVETLGGGMLPLPDGEELHCRSSPEPGAARTAGLRLSRERRQQFTSADVIDGQPHVGDAVFVGGPPEVGSGGIIAPSLLPAELGGRP